MFDRIKSYCIHLILKLLRVILIYCGLYLAFRYLFSPTIGLTVVIGSAAIITYIKAKLRYYGRQYENIYEYSRTPDDTRVYVRAWWHRKWLQWSQNAMEVEVHELPFQAGINCNENWEEYQDRRQAYIQNNRIIRHQDLENKKLKGDKYKSEVLGQKLPHYLTKIFGV